MGFNQPRAFTRPNNNSFIGKWFIISAIQFIYKIVEDFINTYKRA